MQTCIRTVMLLYILNLRFAQGSIDGFNKINVVQENIPTAWSSLKDSEPGFDMSPEEIHRLKLWPDGNVPYFIDDLSYDSTLRNRIIAYLSEVSSVTGLQFHEIRRTPDNDSERYLFFVNRQAALDCVDYSTNDFTNTGVQRVVIGYDCSGGDLGALILAIAGVPPQHNSPDRDNYILVREENILDDKKHLFRILSPSEWLFHDIDYDFTSAGHYDFMQYSRNGAATIVARNLNRTRSLDRDIERGGLTYTDIWKIRMLYNRIIRKREKHNLGNKFCPTLFKPGKNFGKYQADSPESKEEPRAKPLSYNAGGTFRIRNLKPQYDKMNNYKKHESLQHYNAISESNAIHDKSDFISEYDK